MERREIHWARVISKDDHTAFAMRPHSELFTSHADGSGIESGMSSDAIDPVA